MLIRPYNTNAQSPTRWLPECGCLKIKDPPLIILQIFDFRNPIDLRSAPKFFQAYQTVIWGDTRPLTTHHCGLAQIHLPSSRSIHIRANHCARLQGLVVSKNRPVMWDACSAFRLGKQEIPYNETDKILKTHSIHTCRYCNLYGFIEVVFLETPRRLNRKAGL